MPGAGPSLSQAEKQRLRKEQTNAKAAEMSAARLQRQEQHRQLHNTPLWLKTAHDAFQRLHAEVRAGEEVDELEARLSFHERRLMSLIQALETNTLEAASLEPIEDMLNYLVEAPCGRGEIVERLESIDDDTFYDEVAVLHVASAGLATAPPSTAQPNQVATATESLRTLDFAESEAELVAAIQAAEQTSDQAVVDSVAAARRRLDQIRVAGADLPTAEIARRPSETKSKTGGSSSAQDEATLQEAPRHGRTVMNHSTHCPGLLPVLRRLEKHAQLKTAVPGALHEVASRCEEFEMRLQREAPPAKGRGERGGRGRGGRGRGGRGWIADAAPTPEDEPAANDTKFKFVARKGHTAQDVTIVLKPGLQLEAEDVQRLVEEAIDKPRDEPSSSYDALLGEGRLNASGAEMRERHAAEVRDKSKARHDDDKARAKAKEKEKVVAEKARKLQSSGAAREKNLSVDAHAKSWAEVEIGEKEAGKSWGGGRSKRIGPQDVS